MRQTLLAHVLTPPLQIRILERLGLILMGVLGMTDSAYSRVDASDVPDLDLGKWSSGTPDLDLCGDPRESATLLIIGASPKPATNAGRSCSHRIPGSEPPRHHDQ
jgi:hypothetical protein